MNTKYWKIGDFLSCNKVFKRNAINYIVASTVVPAAET